MSFSGGRILITGIVQGVGFRPFVYGLAVRFGLKGWIRNTSAGVDIHVEGEENRLKDFTKALRTELPSLARIDMFRYETCPIEGLLTFEIIHSKPIAGAFQPVSPDVCICPDCLRELFDPDDRRYLYPFINCTNCGPRFTIISDIPYDRPNTSMVGFPLCPECREQYENPLDRRFHAQPVACAVCGPRVWLESSDQLSVTSNQCYECSLQPSAVSHQLSEERGQRSSVSDQLPTYPGKLADDLDQKLITNNQQLTANSQSLTAIHSAQKLLLEGKIVAIKGLGGFHLACDATNPEAVQKLRERKLRVDKPFALMMPDLETIETHCYVNDAERQVLISRRRPIVIMRRKGGSNIASEVAPCQDTLGVMLPYTPLHYLLFSNQLASEANQAGYVKNDLAPGKKHLQPFVFVMTSGNLSEEPIATDNDEARQRLAGLADAFLFHDRPIYTRCDDSVVRITPAPAINDVGDSTSKPASVLSPDQMMIRLRRSRGYAPDPLLLRWKMPPIFATGAELKNTFCLTHERYAFLSHHIGDLQNYETYHAYEDAIHHYERLFRVQPELIAYDLHPDYLSTRYALERAETDHLPLQGVQHHHAHIAACLAENEIEPDQPVIGVTFDGTGYGEDGAIWGGEFLLVTGGTYQRVGHLAYAPLPGGDSAIHKPYRIALAHLWQASLDWEDDLPCLEAIDDQERAILRSQLTHRLNTPLTSSMGRLFDAAAALAGIRQVVNYEAQAAIELEAVVEEAETRFYPFDYQKEAGKTIVDPAPLVKTLIQDRHEKAETGQIAARFHNGVAHMVLEVCRQLKGEYGIQAVALSGGVWQNMTLLKKTTELLRKDHFKIYTHHLTPPNDGGIALGQALVAGWRIGCA